MPMRKTFCLLKLSHLILTVFNYSYEGNKRSSSSIFAKFLTALCFILLSSSSAFSQADDYVEGNYGEDELSLRFTKSIYITFVYPIF